MMSYDIAVNVGPNYRLLTNCNEKPDWYHNMIRWCKDNLEPYAVDFIDIQYGYVLFDCEEDAMAFKLGFL